MILYKYVGGMAGEKIIRSNAIGFSHASDFDDPFELTAYPRDDEGNRAFVRFMSRLRAGAKRSIWLRNTAILSLTRSPLNPLMWAHYGDGHRGFVIGLDVEASGFTSTDMNLVPAQFGSVIYSERRPTQALVSSALMHVGEEFSYRPEISEKLQRLFLMKPLCWSYEEEVRVVKCVKGIDRTRRLPSGPFQIGRHKGRALYLVMLPHDAITEVYLGAATRVLRSDGYQGLVSALRDYNPRARIRQCVVGEDEWTLEANLVSEGDGHARTPRPKRLS